MVARFGPVCRLGSGPWVMDELEAWSYRPSSKRISKTFITEGQDGKKMVEYTYLASRDRFVIAMLKL